MTETCGLRSRNLTHSLTDGRRRTLRDVLRKGVSVACSMGAVARLPPAAFRQADSALAALADVSEELGSGRLHHADAGDGDIPAEPYSSIL